MHTDESFLQAKAGVIGLTKTVAKEWGAFNIRCNGLAYGFIATRLTAEKKSGDSMQVVHVTACCRASHHHAAVSSGHFLSPRHSCLIFKNDAQSSV